MSLIVRAADVFLERRGKTILDIPELEFYDFDRIGLVGDNGAGKTTLLKVLAGEIALEEGSITRYASIAFVGQLDDMEDADEVDPEELSRLGVSGIAEASASGGELTRIKIADALSKNAHAIFADEPTSHLDKEGIDQLITRLLAFNGALLVVSHDRDFLDRVVDKIWELKAGTIVEYWGSYSDYRAQKDAEAEQGMRDFEAYREEKQRLEEIVREKKKQAQRVTNKAHAKKNANKSGGRLAHEKSQGSKEKALYNAAKSVEKRLEALEEVEAPKGQRRLHFKQAAALELHNPYPVFAEDLRLECGEKVLLDGARFEILLGSKVALTGPNGSGKTTLLRAIAAGAPGIKRAPKVTIGYFEQTKRCIDSADSVLAYLGARSDYPVSDIRSALGSVGIHGDEVNKQMRVLSGGQIIKVLLVEVLLGRYNILLLDEPDNYLDVASIEALQHMISDYAGTIIFVTHDQALIEGCADRMLEIAEGKIVQREC